MDPWGACTGQRCALWDLEDFGADVRYWHLADIAGQPPDVRFRG